MDCTYVWYRSYIRSHFCCFFPICQRHQEVLPCFLTALDPLGRAKSEEINRSPKNPSATRTQFPTVLRRLNGRPEVYGDGRRTHSKEDERELPPRCFASSQDGLLKSWPSNDGNRSQCQEQVISKSIPIGLRISIRRQR